MRALLWKDYKTSYQLVYVGIGLLMLPYLFWIGLTIYQSNQIATGQRLSDFIWTQLSISAMVSVAISQLTIVLMGGQIIAGERNVRSLDFLFYLPPSRKKIITSKLLICLIVIATIWIVSMAVYFLGIALDTNELARESASPKSMYRAFISIAVTGFGFFGVAWFGSSMFDSPTFAVGFSVLILGVTSMGIVISQAYLGIPPVDADMTLVLRYTYLALGFAGIVAGWLYFVRRVEP